MAGPQVVMPYGKCPVAELEGRLCPYGSNGSSEHVLAFPDQARLHCLIDHPDETPYSSLSGRKYIGENLQSGQILVERCLDRTTICLCSLLDED